MKPSFILGLDSNWMVGLASLEVYNSIFNITEENKKFEFYTDNFDGFSFEVLKDELEEILSTSDFTPSNLQHEIIRPLLYQGYKKFGLENSSNDSYFILLLGYARSLL